MTAPNHTSAPHPPTAPPEGRAGRLLWVDLVRTMALAGMVVFHFARDLEFFGWAAPGTTLTGGWAVYARLVAGSFLFVSGVSFVLAHGRGFRARAWARRLAMIVAAAAVVTVATYAAFPAYFIYFGILHAIAVASVIAVALRGAPAWLLLAAALIILAADVAMGPGLLDAPWLAWTGLSHSVRPSFDFVPLVPWLAPFLAGMALARAVAPEALEPRWPKAFPVRRLVWAGQHSLAIYLIHQPVLFALFWLVARIGGG